MRLPYAAETLLDQVLEEKPKAEMQNHSDPDGLDVVRTVKFDKRTSAWLADRLTDEDPRIESVELTEAGYLHVTFVPGIEADQRDPFDLEAQSGS